MKVFNSLDEFIRMIGCGNIGYGELSFDRYDQVVIKTQLYKRSHGVYSRPEGEDGVRCYSNLFEWFRQNSISNILRRSGSAIKFSEVGEIQIHTGLYYYIDGSIHDEMRTF